MMNEHLNDQIIEQYVRNRLNADEGQAVEEHYFSCGHCFERIEAMEKFVVGVRDASSRGLLDERGTDASSLTSRRSWLLPAFGFGTCLAIVSAMVAARLSLVQVPALQKQLAQANAELKGQKEARAALERNLASADQAEGNVPLVMLQTTRGEESQPSEVLLPPAAHHLVLWMELPAGTPHGLTLTIESSDGRRIQTLDSLTRNAYGAVAVNLPTEILQSGLYRIRLAPQVPTPGSLSTEYWLRIRRS